MKFVLILILVLIVRANSDPIQSQTNEIQKELNDFIEKGLDSLKDGTTTDIDFNELYSHGVNSIEKTKALTTKIREILKSYNDARMSLDLYPVSVIPLEQITKSVKVLKLESNQDNLYLSSGIKWIEKRLEFIKSKVWTHRLKKILDSFNKIYDQITFISNLIDTNTQNIAIWSREKELDKQKLIENSSKIVKSIENLFRVRNEKKIQKETDNLLVLLNKIKQK